MQNSEVVASGDSDDWWVSAAKAPLPDGTLVPTQVSEMMSLILKHGSAGPMKNAELDAAVTQLLEAWSAKYAKDQNASG